MKVTIHWNVVEKVSLSAWCDLARQSLGATGLAVDGTLLEAWLGLAWSHHYPLHIFVQGAWKGHISEAITGEGGVEVC